MDRRDFLKSGVTAAAVATGSTAFPPTADAKTAARTAAPALLSGACELRLTTPPEAHIGGPGPQRLAKRIETATAGRYRIVIVDEPTRPREPTDLAFGGAHHHSDLHPALAFFAGLPCDRGLDAASLHAWLVLGGGQLLWDELAADFGVKPLLAGHTGPSPGLWVNGQLESTSDFARLRVYAQGVAASVVRALGATPMLVSPQDLKAALSEGRIDAAEWLGPSIAIAPDLQPLAACIYEPGLNGSGSALALSVQRSLWQRMDTVDQAIFEACAAEEWQLSLAEARAYAALSRHAAAPDKWPLRRPFPQELHGALKAAAAEVIASLAAIDRAARRTHDSYEAFRTLLGEPGTASPSRNLV